MIDGSSGNPDKTFDLENVPEKIVRWINLYQNRHTTDYKTKELEDIQAAKDRIACIRIEFEEGEGL